MQAWCRNPDGESRSLATTWSGVVWRCFFSRAIAIDSLRTLAVSGVRASWVMMLLCPSLISPLWCNSVLSVRLSIRKKKSPNGFRIELNEGKMLMGGEKSYECLWNFLHLGGSKPMSPHAIDSEDAFWRGMAFSKIIITSASPPPSQSKVKVHVHKSS